MCGGGSAAHHREVSSVSAVGRICRAEIRRTEGVEASALCREKRNTQDNDSTSCTTSSVQRRTVLRVRAGAGEWRGPAETDHSRSTPSGVGKAQLKMTQLSLSDADKATLAATDDGARVTLLKDLFNRCYGAAPRFCTPRSACYVPDSNSPNKATMLSRGD